MGRVSRSLGKRPGTWEAGDTRFLQHPYFHVSLGLVAKKKLIDLPEGFDYA